MKMPSAGLLSALSLVKNAGALLDRQKVFGLTERATPFADNDNNTGLSSYVSNLMNKANVAFEFGALNRSWIEDAKTRPTRTSLSSSASTSSSAPEPAKEAQPRIVRQVEGFAKDPTTLTTPTHHHLPTTPQQELGHFTCVGLSSAAGRGPILLLATI